jgi:alkylated DNA repair dioxygenase AlkB
VDRVADSLEASIIEQMFGGESVQGSLFGSVPVDFDPDFASVERIQLDDESWLDYGPTWLTGDEDLYQVLAEHAEWTQPVVRMYDREVLTPRLMAHIDPAIHPVVPRLVDVLSERYGVRLDQVSVGWYRDGRDSVAYHGDRIARERPLATVATISLGSPRRFLIRPKAGGQTRSFSLGHGDLVVMGGACQRTWEHAVPKVSSAAGPRMALMFRHVYD